MEIKIDTKKWENFVMSYPSKDGTSKWYYIWSSDFGMFRKKEAEIISDFLRKNMYEIIKKIKVD
jgi:hypothetical protein